MPSRRTFLKWLAGLVGSGAALGSYAFAIEPGFRLRVQRYGLNPVGWRNGPKLRIAVLSDIHASGPYMSADRIRAIAETTNALEPDLTVLLGDFTAGSRWRTYNVEAKDWAAALSGLRAPLGVVSVLGNHDWWDDLTAQRSGQGPTFAERALLDVGIRVLENDAIRLMHRDKPFWLAGLGDQIALVRSWRREPGQPDQPKPLVRSGRFEGRDDLPATLARLTDDAPAILLAHEPDIFAHVPDRFALTLSGHTHGGQVRLFGWSPVVPSQFGQRYAYGHVREGNRDLVISGGLGTSIIPVRFGVPPEIVLIELG